MYTVEAVTLSKIFGPTITLIGIWALMNCDVIAKIWASIKNSPAVLYLGGVLNLLLGFVTITFYNVWSMHLDVLVTLFGWAAIVRGVLFLFAPQIFIKWATSATSNCRWLGIIPVLWGLALCWLGYYS